MIVRILNMIFNFSGRFEKSYERVCIYAFALFTLLATAGMLITGKRISAESSFLTLWLLLVWFFGVTPFVSLFNLKIFSSDWRIFRLKLLRRRMRYDVAAQTGNDLNANERDARDMRNDIETQIGAEEMKLYYATKSARSVIAVIAAMALTACVYGAVVALFFSLTAT